MLAMPVTRAWKLVYYQVVELLTRVVFVAKRCWVHQFLPSPLLRVWFIFRLSDVLRICFNTNAQRAPPATHRRPQKVLLRAGYEIEYGRHGQNCVVTAPDGLTIEMDPTPPHLMAKALKKQIKDIKVRGT